MPPTRNRVVITGLGAITPVGNSVDAFWNALLNGKSGAAKISAMKWPMEFRRVKLIIGTAFGTGDGQA